MNSGYTTSSSAPSTAYWDGQRIILVFLVRPYRWYVSSILFGCSDASVTDWDWRSIIFFVFRNTDPIAINGTICLFCDVAKF